MELKADASGAYPSRVIFFAVISGAHGFVLYSQSLCHSLIFRVFCHFINSLLYPPPSKYLLAYMIFFSCDFVIVV